MIQGVLFDLDGTLFDHREAAEQAVRKLGGRFSPLIRPEELIDAWFISEELHMSEYLAGECSFIEQRRRRMQDVGPLLGLDGSLNELEMDEWFRINYLNSYEAAWKAFPDALETLVILTSGEHQIVTGVVTNGDPVQQRMKVGRIGLLDLVGPIMTPDDLGFAKPDPASFRTACQSLDLDPGRTIYVGDSLSVDAYGANNAGLIGVWLDRDPGKTKIGVAGDRSELQPVTKITDLTQLPPLIRSLSQ